MLALEPTVERQDMTKTNASIRDANEETTRGAERLRELAADTTSHDLRHHYASALLAAGESVAFAERLGHDDASLVLSVYGHLMPDGESCTRKAVDSAWTRILLRARCGQHHDRQHADAAQSRFSPPGPSFP